MIPALASAPNEWRRQLRDAVRDLPTLLQELALSPSDLDIDLARGETFPLLVPRAYLARMQRGDPRDPLLRQILPVTAEHRRLPGDAFDPVGDLARTRSSGLIHKYRGRVLLIATGSCPVHCRYCFRRHFPYAEELAARDAFSAAIEVIANDPGIEEVILSGGDPLSLSTAKLAALTDRLASIPHVRRLRIHTRWPIVLPDRIDGELLRWLRSLRWPVVVVVHTNHRNEIDAGVASACLRLRQSGATLLNQSVLVDGVNDSTSALAELSAALFEIGVLPYYLHLLDPVVGAMHFAVSDDRALALMAELRAALPGYLVPRLVREIAGEPSKTVIA